MNTLINQLLYFILLLIVLSVGLFINSRNKINLLDEKHSIIFISVFSLLLIGFFYLLKLHKCNTISDYQLLQISPNKMCKGGSYLFQGDTELGKMCQKMESTPEGEAAIDSITCATQYAPVGSLIGYPVNRFMYSPNMGECNKTAIVRSENDVNNLGIF